MSWSKVDSKIKKPLGWWYHKLLCEFGWLIRNLIKSHKIYYHHLNKLCEYGINLYGKKL